MASVDDLDELIATRRLNGLDDGLFKESNIEEDIKILEDENQIIYDFTTRKIDDKWKKAYKNIIEFSKNALLESKRDKARIKELEEEKKNKDTYIKMAKEVIENSIIKQKVKALKESVILDNTIVGGRRNAKTLEYGIKLGKIKACEELLEEK